MLSDALDLIYEGDRIPKINPFIANGVAYTQLNDLHKQIHNLMCTLLRKENEPRLPEGFNYIGYELLTPEEEYVESCNKKNKQSNRSSNLEGYQWLPTDTYYVRFIFQNGDHKNRRCMQVIFPNVGGIIRLKGVKYVISPVFKTRGLSVTPKGFFIAFDANPVNFERISRHYEINGITKHVFIPISHDMHRHKKQGMKAFCPPLAAWLFAKHGVHETFKKYLNIEIDIINVNDTELINAVNTKTHYLCRAPKPQKRDKLTDFAVVIKQKDMTREAEVMIGTMFFASAIHGDRMDHRYVHDDNIWKMLLGYATHGINAYNDQKHVFMINDHLSSIEQYVDHKLIEEMLKSDVIIDDIYDLLYHIIGKMTNISRESQTEISNLFHRYLTCAEYVMSGLRSKIQKAQWELITAAKDSTTGTRGNPVSKNTIDSIINRHITADVLTHITEGHGEIAPLQSTTDNMLIGVSSRAIDESDAKKIKGSGKKTVDLNDPKKHLHSSFLEVGSVSNLPKSGPFGFSVLNPYLMTDPYGMIIPKEENVEKLARVQADLNKKGQIL